MDRNVFYCDTVDQYILTIYESAQGVSNITLYGDLTNPSMQMSTCSQSFE